MQTAGSQPGIPAMANAKSDSAPVSTQSARPAHLTSGGKMMIGGGITMVAIGGLVIVMTGVMHDWASSSKKAALFGSGGAAVAAGVTLITFGNRRHSTN